MAAGGMVFAMNHGPAPRSDDGRRSLRAGVVALAAACALLSVPPAAALAAGMVLGLTAGDPWPGRTSVMAQRLLAGSVVGLGAGIDLAVVARAGLHGLAWTAAGIAAAFALGRWLGERLGVGRDITLLISAGTAICGGSAIAAVSPAIRARSDDVSIALATVFLLNAIGLALFPAVGHRLQLGQEAFGLWCALGIHDTSSVVGAASAYGARALEVATAAKLARALWIVPVTLVAARARGTGAPAARGAPRPWFIAGFLAAAALVWAAPALRGPGEIVAAIARRALVVTLFLIGLGLSWPALRAIGPRPLALAVLLWLSLAALSLAAILLGLGPP